VPGIARVRRLGTGRAEGPIRRVSFWLGKGSYAARVEHLGIERIRKIARENGKKGGRPKKGETK